MPFKYSTPIERILANSVIDESSVYDGTFCWTWLRGFKRSRSGQQYPTISIRIRGRVVKLTVHRFIIRYIKGKRLSKRQVGMHMCDNTACVNPAHIVGGTQRQNIRQCVIKGRHDPWSGVNARRGQREKASCIE